MLFGHKPAYFIVKNPTGEPAQGILHEGGRQIPAHYICQ